MNEQQFNEMRDDIKQILKLLNGNGKIGLVAKVQVLWGSVLFVICGVVAAVIRSFWK